MSRKSRKKKQQEQQTKNFARSIALFVPRAPAHAPLVDDKVHVFVDDQNVNEESQRRLNRSDC